MSKILWSLIISVILSGIIWYFYPQFFKNSLQKTFIFAFLLFLFILIVKPIVNIFVTIIVIFLGLIIVWYIVNFVL